MEKSIYFSLFGLINEIKLKPTIMKLAIIYCSLGLQFKFFNEINRRLTGFEQKGRPSWGDTEKLPVEMFELEFLSFFSFC